MWSWKHFFSWEQTVNTNHRRNIWIIRIITLCLTRAKYWFKIEVEKTSKIRLDMIQMLESENKKTNFVLTLFSIDVIYILKKCSNNKYHRLDHFKRIFIYSTGLIPASKLLSFSIIISSYIFFCFAYKLLNWNAFVVYCT